MRTSALLGLAGRAALLGRSSAWSTALRTRWTMRGKSRSATALSSSASPASSSQPHLPCRSLRRRPRTSSGSALEHLAPPAPCAARMIAARRSRSWRPFSLEDLRQQLARVGARRRAAPPRARAAGAAHDQRRQPLQRVVQAADLDAHDAAGARRRRRRRPGSSSEAGAGSLRLRRGARAAPAASGCRLRRPPRRRPPPPSRVGEHQQRERQAAPARRCPRHRARHDLHDLRELRPRARARW